MTRTLLLLLLACVACTQPGPPDDPPPDDGSRPPANGGRGPADPPPTGPKHWDVTVGGVPARVRLARTRSQHYVGLSDVKRLDPDQGMLFKYASLQPRRFWMKGCRVALDIAFLDDGLKVLEVKTLPAPGPGTTDADMPRAASPVPVRWVLELPAGFFRRHGLSKGVAVTVPPAVLAARAE